MKKIDFRKLTTWKSICKAKGIHPVKSLPFPVPTDDTEEGVNAFFQLSTIREVLNDGKDADWDNTSEEKLFLWPNVVKDEKKPSGFGLSYYGYDNTYTYSYVGSRLSFNSREKAKHVFTHFLSILEKFMLITKAKK